MVGMASFHNLLQLDIMSFRHRYEISCPQNILDCRHTNVLRGIFPSPCTNKESAILFQPSIWARYFGGKHEDLRHSSYWANSAWCVIVDSYIFVIILIFTSPQFCKVVAINGRWESRICLGHGGHKAYSHRFPSHSNVFQPRFLYNESMS